MKKFTISRHPRKECSSCDTTWSQKKTISQKGYIQRTKVVKVEEGGADEDEESKKNWKNYNVKALIALHGEMEPKIVKNTKKKVRF